MQQRRELVTHARDSAAETGMAWLSSIDSLAIRDPRLNDGTLETNPKTRTASRMKQDAVHEKPSRNSYRANGR
jgi:hypothetical protein